MRQNQIKNISKLKQKRAELRNNATAAETMLWSALKGSKLKGRKFRRQHSIGNYIVDFYCPAEKLIVELDGEVHKKAGQFSYDNNRDNYLISLGNRILRFENKAIFEHIEGVLEQIARHFASEPPQSAHK